jgi:hypothetical protein
VNRAEAERDNAGKPRRVQNDPPSGVVDVSRRAGPSGPAWSIALNARHPHGAGCPASCAERWPALVHCPLGVRSPHRRRRGRHGHPRCSRWPRRRSDVSTAFCRVSALEEGDAKVQMRARDCGSRSSTRRKQLDGLLILRRR